MPRVDDRRVISGIIFVIKNGLRWRDRPRDCGVPKTIYNPIAARAGPGFQLHPRRSIGHGPMPND
jgi:transposase